MNYESIIEYLKQCCSTEEELSNFEGTAERASKSISEMMLPFNEITQEVRGLIKTFTNKGDSSLVVQKNIRAYSMCPHHILPVEYKVHYAYKPAKLGETHKVLGLSKLVRIVQLLAKRPILHETYVQNLIEILEKGSINDHFIAEPVASGVAAYVEGLHGCMHCRGVLSDAATIVYKSTLSPEDEQLFKFMVHAS